MKLCKVLLLYALSVASLQAILAKAQSPPDPNFSRTDVFDSYADFRAELSGITGTSDPTERTARLDTLWQSLLDANQVPYVQDGRYAFLYRGNSSSVQFAGDHTSWSPSSAIQLPGTNLWINEGILPQDARVDYKIVRNGSWTLDPNNSLQAWSGFGPNSELRMPEYEYPQETVRRPGISQGTITGNTLINSTNLGYGVNYRVYTPANYNASQLADLPVIYVTDGHEYIADHLGSLPAVMDNLIDDQTIRPAIAVFIDPRNPQNPAQNRRQSEYINNRNFARFVADELVPAIDATYRTDADPDQRVILGTSLGGLNSAYFGAVEGDVFHKIAIQSPAFWAGNSIYATYEQPLAEPLEIFMTAGTINDGSGGTTMDAILNQHDYDYVFTQASEGHAWANWRAQLSDVLVGLIGPPLAGDFNGDGQVNAIDFTEWRNQLGSLHSPNDYNAFRDNYGTTNSGPSLSVPEPSSFATLLISVGLLKMKRR